MQDYQSLGTLPNGLYSSQIVRNNNSVVALLESLRSQAKIAG
ncbi:MAG: hypothetical protein RMY34_03040 [Aulosira sp. DedQUE10]|nr:hypothetical protein [Aulosira sp. DedQUE10]